MGVEILGFAYAALVTAGGILGYAKAGSVPSLIAGTAFGTVLCFGAYQLSKDPSNYILTLGATTVLGCLMGYRYYYGRKLMPAGIIVGLSLLMFGKLVIFNLFAKKKVSQDSV